MIVIEVFFIGSLVVSTVLNVYLVRRFCIAKGSSKDKQLGAFGERIDKIPAQ